MQSEHDALVIIDSRIASLRATLRYYMLMVDPGSDTDKMLDEIMRHVLHVWDAVPDDEAYFRGARTRLDGLIDLD